MDVPQLPHRHDGGSVRADAEVVLNDAGRGVLAELCGVEPGVPAHALPAFTVNDPKISTRREATLGAGPVEGGERGDGIGDTVDTMSDQKKAMSLRFPDPEQRTAIAAAARQAGVSMQDYILSAAYDRATAVERRFLDGFKASMGRSGAAFAAEPDELDPSPEQRAAEQDTQRDLERQERGHAA